MGPAPTIRLASTPAPTRPGGAALPSTASLPKATVQLQPPTQPIGTGFAATSHSANLESIDDDDADEAGEGIVNILAIVGFVAAIIVLSFQLMTASTWINAPDNEAPGDWMQLFS